jgi:phage baseplate assembly protein gpV
MAGISDLMRVGTVSSVNYEMGRLRVAIEDQGGIVTDEVPMLSHEYEMPAIGEKVICLFFGNGLTKGVCLGRYFYTQEKPVEYGEDIYFKRFMKDASMKYDRATKTLYLDVQHVVITGDLTTGGDTVADGISLDHHTHGDPQGGSTGGPQ